MKRLMICLLAVFFLLGACATVPVKPIASSDLPVLKGKWEGTREIVINFLRTFSAAELEIYNDTLPLKGKLTLYVPEYIGNEVRTYPFEDGQVDQTGKLIINLHENDRMELSFSSGETKKTLYGSYFRLRQTGRIVLHKK